MKRIPVDVSGFTVLALAVSPAVGEGGSQKTTTKGVPVWAVDCVLTPTDGGGKSETVTVRVVGATPPAVSALTAVTVVGLVAVPWSMAGRSGVVFYADEVVPAVADGWNA